MTKRKIHFLLGCMFLATVASAQEKWDLRRSVEYALQNNISVKQSDVQSRISELTLKQSRLSQFPTLNLGGNVGYSSGRNQDPTTFSLITTGYLSSGFSLQSGVDLFNWFSRRNTIAGNALETEAARAAVDKVKNDIALNVAVAYLQVLLAREQENVSLLQVRQTEAQLGNTRKLVRAGSLPELNAAELEAQLARDSSTLVTAQASAIQTILQLKALLNVDAAVPFDVITPPVDQIPVESLADLQPAYVYELALKNLPQQRVNDLRLKAAGKYVEAARGAMFPTFSAFASLGTNFNNQARDPNLSTLSPTLDTIGKVTVNGTPYDVVRNGFNFDMKNVPYFTQFNQNFRQSIGISVNVPIFNGGSLRTAYQRSKLTLENIGLTRDLDNQTLKQDIYRAYNDATAAIQKYNAGLKSVATAEKANEFASKRYNIGLLNSIDLITNQNNLFRARIDLLAAQYDYVFKLKLLEFYKGQGLKL
ncbi:MAG TPA: TolC family protein [Flavitalea sp.]|nr:TolC family protein [Flavitalea sp.]